MMSAHGLSLDHIGYVVADIHTYFEEFLKPLCGVQDYLQICYDPLQRVQVAFATTSNGVRIELIQPCGEDSPVHKVLQKRKGGLHHLCFNTDSLEGEIERFRGRGFLLFSGPHPAVAFGGRRIAFILTPQYDLIELLESHREVQK
jgi:methylmalonyl-CoA/ethylmalonyl-CoA epimerase